jgi:hypothetical protein
MWIVFLIIVLLFFLAVFVYLRIIGHGSFPWIPFYTKGKESGFTFKEINLLRRVAIETKLENPSTLFWSIKKLDRSIKQIIVQLRSQGREEEAEANYLLTKLFELRKRIEFDQPRYKLGLKSSRDIAARQRVKITLPGLGPFVAMVIENRPRYFALSYPQGAQTPEGFSWKGQQIGIHFWRTGDAGYFMKTKVIDDFYDQKYPILHVSHSDNLIRTQQRKSVRAATNLSASLYPLKSISEANEMVEESRGLRCKLKDISEDGAAVMVGGRTKAGLPVKIQVALSDKMVVLCGVVKGVNYQGKKNVSLLHMQATQPGNVMRNAILCYVYNLFGEQESKA